MADNYDQLALKWVREEVNKTLDQARQALEAYADNPDDATQIQFCGNCLHQVRGTLTMLEFYGAALFAEEMEALADAIAKNTVKVPAKAQEILMGTILQLPTYLERVQAGRRDLPVVLLPMLNDLRASRGETLLSESSIFTPVLAGVKAPQRAAVADAPQNDAEFRDQAKKLRHHYQRGLLGVFRNQEVVESLTRLLKVVERFEAINSKQPIGLLWWVSAGFIEAIAENNIYKNASVHALLGQVDKYIKQMGDDGEMAAYQETPPELLKNLLYYVACSEKDSVRCNELRDAYHLRDALPSAAQIEAERSSMSGPDAGAIRTVLQALNDDLAGVKDGLDLYVRSKAKNPQDLINLLPSLRQIADTLAMLGLGVPRDAVRTQVDALQRLTDTGGMPNEMHVMDIAGALLVVEANLSTVAQNAAQMAATDASEDMTAGKTEEEIAASAQFDSARETLLQECRSNLQKCKDAIIDFMASQWDHRLIEAVPTQLTEVEGGLAIIGLPEAGEMVHVCQQFMATRVVNVGGVPDIQHLDALADVLTSVEYFLESLQEAGGSGLESVLSAAHEPMESLRAEFGKPLPDPTTRPAPVLQTPKIVNMEAELPDIDVPDAPEKTAATVPVASSTSVSVTPVMATAGGYAPSIQRPSNDTVDDEVIEIFIEEAAEQIDVIKDMLPRWQANENDRDSLTTLRRAFHTLKGSGRLVGAKLLGETAWSIENMLNRVLDQTIAPSRAVMAVVQDAASVHIPHLRESFAAMQEPTIRPENMIAQAEALSRGEMIDVLRAAPSAQVAPVVAVAPIAPPEPEPLPELVEEPVLVEEAMDGNFSSSEEGEFVMGAALSQVPKAESPADVPVSGDFVLQEEFHASEPEYELETLSAEAVDQTGFVVGEDLPPIERLALPDDSENLSEFALPVGDDVRFGEAEPELITMEPVIEPVAAVVAAAPVIDEVEIDGETEADRTVLDIFAGEANTNLDVIEQYVLEAAASPFSPKISDELIRSLHTLKGSAKMAGLDSVANVMLPLEKLARDIQQHDASVPSETLSLLADATAGVRAALRSFESGGEFNDASLVMLATQATAAVESTSDTLEGARNPEVVALFMNEAMDMLSDIDLSLTAWQLDRENPNAAAIAELFSLLQQAAHAASLLPFEDVAHHAAQLFDRAQQHPANGELFTLGRDAHDALVDMLDFLAADQHIRGADALNARLAQWPVQAEVAAASAAAARVVSDTPQIRIEAGAAFTVPDIAESFVTPDLAESIMPSRDAVAKQSAEVMPEAIFTDTDDSALPTNLPVYAAGDVPQALNVDSESEEILQIYLEEADDILLALDEVLEGWSAAPNDKATIATLQRYLHTLKGGARLSDLSELGNLSHEFENLFEAMHDGRMKATPTLMRVAREGRDRIADLVNEVREKRTQTKPSLYWQRLQMALAGQDPYSALFAQNAQPGASAPVVEVPVTMAKPVMPAATDVANVLPFTAKERSETPEKTALDKAADNKQSAQIEYIRVPADRLEGLVNLAGESSIFRGRIEQQMTVVRTNLQEMEATVARLREQLHQLEIETDAQVQYRKETVGADYTEFDPLEFDRYTRQSELSRALAESAGDLLNLKESLDNLAADAETLLLQQGRVNSELHDSLIRSRMVPFSSLVPRLKRMVRQISEELGKSIEIATVAEGEMDRTVLERMVAPIEHMMRNAIDHGIERPEKRIAAGKPSNGRIRIRLTREGGEVIIEIQDDGGGINTEAVRRKAIERGLITESTKLTEHELMLMIFEAGFSTAEAVTQISGRGVGMDVVASEIKALGGRIDIDSERGKGSKFTVRLPFTVSVNQALMVQLGEDIMALPLANIEGIVRVSPYELQTYYENDELRYEYAGQQYRMRYLGTLLDHQATPRFEGVYKPVPILLLHGTDQPVALHVDELLGSREIVVKTVGNLLSTISGLSGATILGDGRVVLILDIPALLRRADATLQVESEEAHVVAEMPLVLVVDDSVTVRKVTGRLLERSGYRVQTAKDGVDAVNVLHDIIPDIMLLDIEMPRMDGFELANIVRHDDRLKDIPIIMITSRTGDKHRSRAEEIGVNRYLGKPFNDVELLSNMQELLDERK